MNKKKLLIINKSFGLGGIQMALVNMLEAIHDDYDISLAVFNPRGPFLERVPENVKLLKLSPLVEVLGMTYSDCKKYGTYLQRIFKIVGTVWTKLIGNSIPIAFALAFQKYVGEYDVVISYHQEVNKRTLVAGFGKFALKKTVAKKKIAWVHADVIAAKIAAKRNLRMYAQFDQIVCVSKTMVDVFKTAYPTLQDKCDCCYNTIPVANVIEKGNLERNVFQKAEDDIVLFSACRITEEKGLVPALRTITPILKKYGQLKWFIAGTGPMEQELKLLIAEKGLENQVILLGFKENPYPYMKEANYLFLPSLHESFSMVVSEAHVLGTSVIASDIPIMHEMLDAQDHLCRNQDYASVIEGLINSVEHKKHFAKTTDLAEWKVQFERILEC